MFAALATSLSTFGSLSASAFIFLASTSLRSALCRRQEASFQIWFYFGKTVSYVFARPALAVVGLMVVAGVLWWVGRKRWKRSPRLRRTVLVGTLGLLISFALLLGLGTRLLTALIPADSGESAEVIVILGRGPTENDTRVRTAAALWRSQRAPLLFASGRGDAPIVARALERQENVSKTVIVQERCSISTDENAEFTAAILLPRGLEKIILVTDPPHMLRSLLTFKSFGFEVIAHPTQLAENTTNKSSFLALRESLGAISYGLLGRYIPRQLSAETIAEADKLVAQQLRDGAATAIEDLP